MSKRPEDSWRKEFGLEGREAPYFFADASELDLPSAAGVPAHLIRSAFTYLGLHGVLCQDNLPLIYFRRVEKITQQESERLHKTFWNQGIAPILVLIDDTEVCIYSSLEEPTQDGDEPSDKILIQRLSRVEKDLRSFLISVESKQYFYEHREKFDPQNRIDRNLLRNLKAARAALDAVESARKKPQTIDSLLCRFVFVCYLFDRGIIDQKYLEQAGIRGAATLQDILGSEKPGDAKEALYKLFKRLAEDFNGDLFQGDLDSEEWQLRNEHIRVLWSLSSGNEVDGQLSFWPSYRFDVIPIEIISSIYEYFLKVKDEEEKKNEGAYYTPPFLAELVLDVALDGVGSLVDKRFLDPACGSGIFLVGIFHRIAEEWRRSNPGATPGARLKALSKILRENLYGVDKNPTACMIAAFSLYLALLEQLKTAEVRGELKRAKIFPRLVKEEGDGNIRCADFFSEGATLPQQVHFVIGNPPWAEAKENSLAAVWCQKKGVPFPGNQITAAFFWKAPEALLPEGKLCLLAPHGLLFNHSETTINFQKQWFRSHSTELILNLADYQRFLFEESEAPALVFRATKERPANTAQKIDYWSPKSDWAVMSRGVISIQPQDRTRLTLQEVLNNIEGEDAPSIWKDRYWATFRDRKLIERLRLYPRLRDTASLRGEKKKRWVIAEGFEPLGKGDSPSRRKVLEFRNTAKVEAGTHNLALVLSSADCKVQGSLVLELRADISEREIFKKPLVLIKRGASIQPQVAFADLDVAYKNGIRGIHGPDTDRDLLALFTFYLRSRVALYFLFHLSGSWGLGRARTDIHDLMRLPFPLPEDTDDPERAAQIVAGLGRLMTEVAAKLSTFALGRGQVVAQTQDQAESLIEEYLGIDETDRRLIDDTLQVIVPSVRPSPTKEIIPTLKPVTSEQARQYVSLLCDTLNQWAKGSQVHGRAFTDEKMGVGMVVLEKTPQGQQPNQLDAVASQGVLSALARLQEIAKEPRGSYELLRGLKVFDKNLLYITKPIGLRFWTQTAALNDADEIAGTLLMQQVERASQ